MRNIYVFVIVELLNIGYYKWNILEIILNLMIMYILLGFLLGLEDIKYF